MDAMVTAGGIPQVDEPLYEYTKGSPKALLDVAGKPMVQWVLDAISKSAKVERVVLIGLEEDSGLTCTKPITYMPNQGAMIENIRTGVKRVLEINPAARHILIVSSDIPSITGEMVDWVVGKALETDDDVYYNVITRQTMEATFPGSKRSFTKLKDIEVCGGDMNVIRAMTAATNEELWKRIIAARKSVFKQAALIGYGTLILFLLRQITMEGAIKRVCKRLNIKGRAIVCPYAEVGMDVDKPHQLEMLRAYITSRNTS